MEGEYDETQFSECEWRAVTAARAHCRKIDSSNVMARWFFQPAEEIAVLPLLDHLEQRRAELHRGMGLQLDRHVDPVQGAQPRLDQVQMRRGTDVPAPGRKPSSRLEL